MNKPPFTKVLYYRYPGDGYNWWKVVVQTDHNQFIGTSRVYPNGFCMDGVRAHGITKVDASWEPLTLAQAAEYTK